MRWRASVACGLALTLAACVGGGRPPRDAGRPAGGQATGRASWYGAALAGRRTASGERFDPEGLTAAHRRLPLGTLVEVTALDTGRAVVVRINDRGPFRGRRIIDLSHGAARLLGTDRGDGRVMLRTVPSGPRQGLTRRGTMRR